MNFPLPIQLTHKATGASVQGFIQPTTIFDLELQRGWQYHKTDEDENWDWESNYFECLQSEGRLECYSARVDQTLQGLMVLDLEGHRVAGERSLGIDYLAANPANRSLESGLKFVGVALFSVAILRSFERGMEGRLWLESLSGAQTFYERLGMRRHTRKSRAGYFIYSLETNRAKELLEKFRNDGILLA